MMATTRSSGLRSLLALVAGIVVLVTLLSIWGGWALPVVIGAIIFMVMGHEFGHFITAKRAGMQVTDFFVGFGPVIWSRTFGETRYGVRAFLLGGYVKVPGMGWGDEIAPELEARTYRSATYPRKVIFASAGSFMHVVMALALAWASLTFIGLPSSSAIGISAFSHWDGYSKNAAQVAGLRVGDRIIEVNGKQITSANTLIDLVHKSAGTSLTLVVLRGGRDLTIRATPVNDQNLTVNGQKVNTTTVPQGLLGVELAEQTVRSSWYGAIPSSFTQIGSTIAAAAHAMVHVFSPGEFTSLYHQVTSPETRRAIKGLRY